MTWVKIDDQFADHPKVVGLTDGAFRQHLTAICYAARHETDGLIPRAAAFVNRKRAAELVDAGLWETDPLGFLVHDFLEYNPAAASLRTKRALDSERKKHGFRGLSNSPVPVPVPVPLPIPEEPPLPPASGGISHASRVSRAKNGSGRKRDIDALREGQSTEERYLGRYAR